MEMKPTKIQLERTMSAPASVPPQVEKRYKEGADNTDVDDEDSAMETSLKSKLEELNHVANILTQKHPGGRGENDSAQTSPSVEEDGEEGEEEDEEGGAHDTITSLAGAKMMQKYQRQIRGHGLMRRGSQGSKTQLEQLFKEEPLLEEEEKIGPSEEEDLEEDDIGEEDVFVPPDGGYGWWITFGAFLSLFWTAGLVKSYGVIFAEMVRLYPDSIKIASWIPAAMTTTALAMAPIASALCQKLNCRLVTTAGSLLAATGLVLSALAPNLILMFVTLGILTGAGIGLSTTPGIILTARYFDKKRSRANALCLSGTAAGSFTLPMLIEYLFSVYGLEGTLLILGGCMLHVLVSASLYRPLAEHVLIVRNEARKAANKPPATKPVYNQPILRSNSLNKSRSSGLVLHRKNSSTANIQKEVDGPGQGEYEPLNQISSSCPQTGFLDSARLNHHLEEYENSLSKGRAMDRSLDSISMISSVSNRSGDTDLERCQHSHKHSSRNHSNHISRSESRNSHAKSVSLREIALHQIGSQINLYKTMLFGSPAAAATSASANSQPRPTIHTQKSHDPKTGKKSSFMFSCEDIMVDSTSILKDSRHPSHTHLSSIPGIRHTHRVVTLNRTQSAAGDVVSSRRNNMSRHPSIKRQRFYSESEKDPYFEVSKHSSTCNLSNSSSNKVSLIGSTELVAEVDDNKEMLKPSITHDDSEPRQTLASSICSCFTNILDLSLCKNPVFVVIALSVMLMAIGMPHTLFFMPAYAISVGLTSSDASLLLSLSAVCDLCGRLSFGVLIDMNFLPTCVWYSSMILLSGVTALLIPTATTFNEILVYLALFGVGTGGWFLMVPLLLAEYLGVEKIGSSYGLVRLLQSVTNLFGPIIAGYLYGTLGKIEISFFFMGSCMMLSGVVSLFLPLALRTIQTKST